MIEGSNLNAHSFSYGTVLKDVELLAGRMWLGKVSQQR